MPTASLRSSVLEYNQNMEAQLILFRVYILKAPANGLVTRGYIPQSGAQLVERRGNSP